MVPKDALKIFSLPTKKKNRLLQWIISPGYCRAVPTVGTAAVIRKTILCFCGFLPTV